MNEQVSRVALERALSDIRRDIAYLHKDLAYSMADDTRRIFLIAWLVIAMVLSKAFELSMLEGVFWSAGAVGLYGIIEGAIIRTRAVKLLKEPLEPEFNTRVDLSQ